MSAGDFRFLTVGWEPRLIERLWAAIGVEPGIRVSHLLHPRVSPQDWAITPPGFDVDYFRKGSQTPRMPEPDRALLASIEADDVPTIHNMILGDRVVSKLPYEEALSYATYLAMRLREVYESTRPDAVISGFDGLHAGISMGVARRMGIPWFVMHFSVIPAGLACFCDRLSPAARVPLSPAPDRDALRAQAKAALERFETRELRAPAYLAPPLRPVVDTIRRLPARVAAVRRIRRSSTEQDYLRYTDVPARYSLAAATALIRNTARAHRITASIDALDEPPGAPFVLFGLHRQPESSTDVWAPFFSNQLWVIELLSRSIPATHRLLVKVHKSDAANYSAAQFDRMLSLPGVQLVRPFADARRFIERADLVVAIQGTMGLEAALLGKPVIMLGNSPVTRFPSVAGIGPLIDLPSLVRRKLADPPPARGEIIEAFADYLAPFRPASHNDWNSAGDPGEPARFARLFMALRQHLTAGYAIPSAGRT